MRIRATLGLVAAAVLVWWFVATIEPREVSRRSQCINNLKQIGLAIHNYLAANDEFPAGTLSSAKVAPEKRLGWLYTIMPFLESTPCSSRLDRDEPYDSPINADFVVECRDKDTGEMTRRNVPVGKVSSYCCPSHHRQLASMGVTRPQYVGITGVGPDSATLATAHPRAGVFSDDRHVQLEDIRDGLSNTMMVAETSFTAGPWTSGAATLRAVDPARRPYLGPGRDFGGNHPGGGLVLLADGSVKYVRDSTDPKVFEALSTINGGENIPGVITFGHLPGRNFYAAALRR